MEVTDTFNETALLIQTNSTALKVLRPFPDPDPDPDPYPLKVLRLFAKNLKQGRRDMDVKARVILWRTEP